MFLNFVSCPYPLQLQHLSNTSSVQSFDCIHTHQFLKTSLQFSDILVQCFGLFLFLGNAMLQSAGVILPV